MQTKPEIFKKHFERMGAKVRLSGVERLRSRQRFFGESRPRPYTIDIISNRHQKDEEFSITIADKEKVDVSVLQVDPADRHLLLLFKQKQNGTVEKHHYLCGHDERHWFVAAVPTNHGITNIRAAKEALKPKEVIKAQGRCSDRKKNINKRKNNVFIRQGEWFFIPAPELTVDDKLILKNEPIRRGGGKPHMVEYVFRRGGVTVYVCSKYPNGVDEETYERLMKEDPNARWNNWRIMRKDMEVFAKGKVTHSDHTTIYLAGWHRVVANTEAKAPWIENMTFLD